MAILVGAGARMSRYHSGRSLNGEAREHGLMVAPIIIVDPKRGSSSGSSDGAPAAPRHDAGDVYEHGPMVAPIIIVDPKRQGRA